MAEHPDWQDRPCAVVSEDKPEGTILWVNRSAREQRVLPGLRFITALGLAPDLRAGAISDRRVGEEVQTLTERLQRFSPDVEPYPDGPGCFWLNAAGLGLLYPQLIEWARELRADLRSAGYYNRVAVGFTRFGSFAAACAGKGTRAFATRAEERRAIQRVPLARLEVIPKLRLALERLGVHDVNGLLRLPPGGLRTRFGVELHRLHRLAAGEDRAPLTPQRTRAPLREQLFLDDAEADAHRLLFFAKRMLAPLLKALAARGEALTSLRLRLLIDVPAAALRQSSMSSPAMPASRGAGPRRGEQARRPLECAGGVNDVGTSGPDVRGGAPCRAQARRPLEAEVRPAVPTLDEVQLVDLLRLRLEHLELAGGAVELELEAEGVRATEEQLRLFAEQPRRDLAAADRALARLRAELGEQAVVRAELREAHLPEARFSWRPLDKLPGPRPDLEGEPALIRRLHARAQPLPPRLRLVPEGWMLGKHEHGAVERLHGPFVVSGGWWAREVHREYHFAETQRGQLLWIYNDRKRRRWLLQGEVR